jgi:hypothetical protein
MVDGVPIARGDDRQASRPEAFDPAVERRDHRIAGGHCQGAARQEIVLHIDDQQRVLRRQGERFHRDRSG